MLIDNTDFKNLDQDMVAYYKGKTVLIKYGGNAMLNDELKHSVMQDVCILKELGAYPVVVHGGGPFINELLDQVGVHSEFIGGLRKTTPEALVYIEMALKGRVNGDLVRIINSYGQKAVGLSGKDASMAIAEKLYPKKIIDGKEVVLDLLQVGDVVEVSTSLLRLLLDNGYIPVIATIASGRDHTDYNINADMFAGRLAGGLNAEAYIAMTDVDGLMMNPNDKNSLVSEITIEEIQELKEGVIKGGMLPKMDSCITAFHEGVKSIRIINGTRKHSILCEIYTKEGCGTMIKTKEHAKQ